MTYHLVMTADALQRYLAEKVSFDGSYKNVFMLEGD